MGRTIWIGDVHGCARELEDLFQVLGLGSEDQLVFVGDLVARGPDTKGVLRLVRETGAACVRGNHEQRLLAAYRARQEGTRSPRLGPSHQALLRELEDEDWQLLENLPLSLEFEDHGIRVVHAGVQPGLPFAEQQPWTLLHVRSLTSHGAASDRYSPASWAAAYEGPPHIVFGHNAQAGLQFHPAATGLDTACVYGDRLSALVLPSGVQPPRPSERAEAIVSVPAHARYVDFGPRPARKP